MQLPVARVAPAQMTQTRVDSDDQALMDFAGFDELDLVANRAGQFSAKQSQKLFVEPRSAANRLKGLLSGLVFGGLLLGVAAFGVSAIPTALTQFATKEIVDASLGLLCPILLVVGGSIAALIVLWGGISKALGRQDPITLHSISGPVNLVAVEHTSSHRHHYIKHELHIGGRKFIVSEAWADHLMQGDGYTIYYLDDGSILSLERATKPEG